MDAVDIVPGDVLIVRLGDIVPADIKLLGDEGDADEQPMQIDQAALTGESLPAKKFTGDVAFSGSTIKQGERHALVYATGAWLAVPMMGLGCWGGRLQCAGCWVPGRQTAAHGNMHQ